MELIHGRRQESPILRVNFPFFELFAIAIPLFLLIWILFKLEFPFRIFKPLSIWAVSMLLIIVVTSFLTNANYSPGNFNPGNTTTIDTTMIPQTLTNPETVLTESIPEHIVRDPLFNLPVLQDVRNLLLVFLILISTIIIIRTERRKSIKQSKESESAENGQKIPKEFEGGLKNIIECYYQTSDHLEGQGADDSDHLTPKEFQNDVSIRQLTSENDFNDLTSLFNEAKFSEHDISADSVQRAKFLSQKIIFQSSHTEFERMEEEE